MTQGFARPLLREASDVGRDHVCAGRELPGERTVFHRRRPQRHAGVFEVRRRISTTCFRLAPATGNWMSQDTTAGVGGQFGILSEPQERYPCRRHLLLSDQVEFLDDADLLEPGDHRGRPAKQRAAEPQLDLGITVPQHVILSGYHELSDTWAIMGDFGWDNWSQFGEVDVAVTAVKIRRR